MSAAHLKFEGWSDLLLSRSAKKVSLSSCHVIFLTHTHLIGMIDIEPIFFTTTSYPFLTSHISQAENLRFVCWRKWDPLCGIDIVWPDFFVMIVDWDNLVFSAVSRKEKAANCCRH